MGDMEHRHGAAHRVARNSAFLLFSRLQGVFFTVIIFSLTARYLGAEQFGLYAVMVAVSMAVRPLVDFGFESIICREIAKDREHASLYVGTTLNVRLAMSAAVLALAYIFSQAYSPWGAEANRALMLAVVAELCMSMGVTFLAVVRAYERMGWELITNTIHKGSSLVLLVLVVYFDMGFLAIFYARVVPAALHLLFSSWVLFRRFVKFTPKYDAGFAKFILKESYPIAVFAILLTLVLRVDVFFLQWLKGARDVAIFEVPNRLISQVQIFAVSLSVSLFPALSRSAAMGAGGQLEAYYRNAFKLLFLAGTFVAGAMVSGGAPMIAVLVGREFMESGSALKILAPSALFLFLTALQSLLLTAMGRQVVNMGSIVVVLLLNAALDLLLVPRYSYIGASIATLVSYFTLVAINSFFIRRHGLALNLRREMFGISLSGVLMCLTTFINAGGDVATIAVRLIVGTSVFAAGVFATKAVTVTEIRALREIFTSRKKRRFGPDSEAP